MLWAQGGAEDWYSCMGLPSHGKKPILLRFSLMSVGSDLNGSQLFEERHWSFRWNMLNNAGAKRIPLEDRKYFFPIGNFSDNFT